MYLLIKKYLKMQTDDDLNKNNLSLSDYRELGETLQLWHHMKKNATIKYGVTFLSSRVADWLKKNASSSVTVSVSKINPSMFEVK